MVAVFRARRERPLDLAAKAQLALARPEHPRCAEECEVTKSALDEMPRRQLAGGDVVGKDARKFRLEAALEQLDHRLADFAIHLGETIVVNLADDAVPLP